MQTVGTDFTDAVAASKNDPRFGLLVSWDKSYDENATFFTIGVSETGGPDMIKSSGDDPAFFDKYSWVDETAYMMSATVSRIFGRYHYGLMQAQAEFDLDNTSKRFLPGVDPDIGNYIKTRRPIRFNAGFGSEDVPLFVGYTGEPKNTLVARQTKLTAVDAMDYLDSFESDLDVFEDEYWHDIFEALLTEAGFDSTQWEIEDSLQPPIKFLDPKGRTIGSIARQACEAEQGIVFVSELGKITFWNRLHFWENSTQVHDFDYDNLTDIKFAETPVINHVRVTAKPREVQAKQKLWELTSPVLIPPGQSVKIGDPFIAFSDEDGELPVTAIDTPAHVSTSPATSFYSTNQKEDGSGADGESYITVTDTHLFGTKYLFEVSNSSTGTPIYITALEIWGTPAKVSTYIEQEYKDQDSIDDHGLNPANNGEVLKIDNDLIQDSSTAAALAFVLVDENKNPRQQLEIGNFPAPHLQFGDAVGVTITDTGESDKTMFIVGQVFRSTLQKLMQHSMFLEEKTLRDYFAIGVSAIGGPDAIAP